MTISELQERIGVANAAKGWHSTGATPVERIALIITEAAEAIEEIRNAHPVGETYYPNGTKPEGVPSEIADIVIRCLDFSYIYGIDLEAMITEKLAYNTTRAHRHGNKTI